MTFNCNFNFCIRSGQNVARIFSVIQVDRQGHAVAKLVEALRYKSEGRGFDAPPATTSHILDTGPYGLVPNTRTTTPNHGRLHRLHAAFQMESVHSSQTSGSSWHLFEPTVKCPVRTPWVPSIKPEAVNCPPPKADSNTRLPMVYTHPFWLSRY